MIKKTIFALMLSVLTGGLFAQEEQVKAGSVIKFEETTLDFGSITQGATVEHTFVFENIGTTPLRILSARGSCGCTVPKYAKDEVKPGGKGEVFVRFNSAGKLGKQNKTVTLVTNAETNNRVVLTLRGTVVRKDTDD